MTGGWQDLWWVKNESYIWVSVATEQIPWITAGSSPTVLCSALIASIRLLCLGACLLSQEGSGILLVPPMSAPQQALREWLWMKKWIMCNSLEALIHWGWGLGGSVWFIFSMFQRGWPCQGLLQHLVCWAFRLSLACSLCQAPHTLAHCYAS